MAGTDLHPMSSVEIARLAHRTIDRLMWTGDGRIAAREHIASIERMALSGPADGSPGARAMSMKAMAVSDLAVYDMTIHDFLEDGQDLSWLKSPVLMDGMARDSFSY